MLLLSPLIPQPVAAMLRLIARSSQVARTARIARPSALVNSAAPAASHSVVLATAARCSRRAFSSATPKDGSSAATPAATPATPAAPASATPASPSPAGASSPADKATADPAASAADSLPDLASFPSDEDPAVTAKRLLLAEDVSREKNRRDLFNHWGKLGLILGAMLSFKLYRSYTHGDPVLSNPLARPVHRPSPTFDPNPAAEDSQLWHLLRLMHPGIEPIPELAEQWARAREQKARRLEWDASAEGQAHWESNKTKADWERMQYGFLPVFEVDLPVQLTEEQREKIREAAKKRAF